MHDYACVWPILDFSVRRLIAVCGCPTINEGGVSCWYTWPAKWALGNRCSQILEHVSIVSLVPRSPRTIKEQTAVRSNVFKVTKTQKRGIFAETTIAATSAVWGNKPSPSVASKRWDLSNYYWWWWWWLDFLVLLYVIVCYCHYMSLLILLWQWVSQLWLRLLSLFLLWFIIFIVVVMIVIMVVAVIIGFQFHRRCPATEAGFYGWRAFLKAKLLPAVRQRCTDSFEHIQIPPLPGELRILFHVRRGNQWVLVFLRRVQSQSCNLWILTHYECSLPQPIADLYL